MCARNTRRTDCNFYRVIVKSCLFVTAPLLDIKDIIPSTLKKNRNKLSFTSSIAQLDYECKYNKRVKYFVDDNGEFVPLQVMYSRRFIFNPDRVEKSDITRRVEHKNDWNNILDEMYGYSGNVPLLADKSTENLERSKRRAKSKLVDYILCNPFDLFCTLTLIKVIDANDLWCIFLKMIPMAYAFYIGSMRIAEYRHHTDDVVAGLLIGFVVAAVCFYAASTHIFVTIRP